MRIVHVSTLHPALDVRIFHKECRSLAAAGHDVHLLVHDAPPGSRDGVHFHCLRRADSAFRPLRIRSRLAETLEQALALRANAYHLHDAELILIAEKLKRSGTKIVYDVHDDSPQEALDVNPGRPLYARAKRLAFNRLWARARKVVDRFVCATPHLATKFPADRTITLCNYPMLEEFAAVARARPATDSNPTLIFTGGISAIRGAAEMVQAMSMLPKSLHAKLLFLGDFQPPELSTRLSTMPGWSRVEHIAWQPREVVVEHLSRSSAGLVLFQPGPNHTQALPNKLFEYMATGLPVIASEFPLWCETILRENCGRVVDPRCPEAISRAIIETLSSPEEAAAMGQRGAEAVASRYNWERESEKLVEMYAELPP